MEYLERTTPPNPALNLQCSRPNPFLLKNKKGRRKGTKRVSDKKQSGNNRRKEKEKNYFFSCIE